ncbi:MAG: diguanylate cyclase [Pseudomonadota bacterium]
MAGPRATFLFLLLAFAGFGAHPAAAQAGLAGLPVATCVARDAPGLTPARALLESARFDCRTPQTAFGPGDFWVRSARLPADIAADRPIAVRTASLWQARMTLYAYYPDGEVVPITTDDRAAARSLQLGAIVERRLLPRGDIAPTVLLWHVEDAANLRGIINGVRLATPTQSASSNMVMAALYAAFAGFAFALLIYNLALWRALRHRFQLAYVAMLGCLLVYALSSSGALAWVWPGIANTDRLRVNYAALALCGITALAFARDFFEPRIFAGWVGRMATAVGTAIALSATAFAVLAPWRLGLLDAAYSVAFAGMVLVVGPVLWRAWRLRSDYRWLFAVAWAAPVVLAAVRVAHNVFPLPWNFWLDNSTLVTMTLEALLSSLAIAYRVRGLARDRDEARVQEIAARLLADTDPLTGLLNRRAFLGQAIGRAGEHTLLVLDIDHFKRVNDTIGHDGGDEVLRRFARVMREITPPTGLAARLGGEEFAILLPAGTGPAAEFVLARLREARMPFDLTVTASIGGCTGPLADETGWKALYRAADAALFEAKAAGRDRVRARNSVQLRAA